MTDGTGETEGIEGIKGMQRTAARIVLKILSKTKIPIIIMVKLITMIIIHLIRL